MAISKILIFNRVLILFNVMLIIALLLVWKMDYRSSSEKGVFDAIAIKSENGIPLIVMQEVDGAPVLVLNDRDGNPQVQLQGGEAPGVLLKSKDGELVGTFFAMEDGGAALGLGDASGDVAAFMRGGSSPNLSFYQKSPAPNLAMGIAEGVPHFYLSPMVGSDRFIIHGGMPTSLIFMDEEGASPVILSKYGLSNGEGFQKKHDKEPNTKDQSDSNSEKNNSQERDANKNSSAGSTKKSIQTSSGNEEKSFYIKPLPKKLTQMK